jgi:hypothetical protein
VEALVQSGYRPSRTLVLSLMLGEVRHPFHLANHRSTYHVSYQAADIPRVSDYLHTAYDKHGLEMGFKPPPLVCGNRHLDRMLYTLRAVFDTLYRGVSTLFSFRATPDCPQRVFDDGEQQVTACCIDRPAEPMFCSHSAHKSLRLCY